MSTTVTFAGNLAEDPELIYTRDHKPFVSCRVLVNRRVQNDEGAWVNEEPHRTQRQGLRIRRHPRPRQLRLRRPDHRARPRAHTPTHAYAVLFIVTNIPTYDDAEHGQRQTVVDVEAWFRRRTDIEDRIREAKLGAGLRHLPSGHAAVNAVWMWAALLAGNLSVLLQALTGIDEAGRAHAARLRHELLCVPARLVHHARGLTLRLPPGDHLLPTVLTRIRDLDTAA
jgi:hypothetical protein